MNKFTWNCRHTFYIFKFMRKIITSLMLWDNFQFFFKRKKNLNIKSSSNRLVFPFNLRMGKMNNVSTWNVFFREQKSTIALGLMNYNDIFHVVVTRWEGILIIFFTYTNFNLPWKLLYMHNLYLMWRSSKNVICKKIILL